MRGPDDRVPILGPRKRTRTALPDDRAWTLLAAAISAILVLAYLFRHGGPQ